MGEPAASGTSPRSRDHGRGEVQGKTINKQWNRFRWHGLVCLNCGTQDVHHFRAAFDFPGEQKVGSCWRDPGVHLAHSGEHHAGFAEFG